MCIDRRESPSPSVGAGVGMMRGGGLYGRPRSPPLRPSLAPPTATLVQGVRRATIKACTPSPRWRPPPIPTTLAPTDHSACCLSPWLRHPLGCCLLGDRKNRPSIYRFYPRERANS